MKVTVYILWALGAPSMFGLLLIALGGLDWGVRAVALFSLIGISAVAALTIMNTRTWVRTISAVLEEAGNSPEAR